MMLVVLTAGFASCSNDDIPMEEDVTYKTFETTFKINPKTVIEPFTWEFQSGELQIFDDKYQLRVRLLLYNQVGEYIDEDVQKFPNYKTMMESSKQLQAGSYKAVVITDLELKTSYSENDYVKEFWELSSDYKNGSLSKLKITDAGYTGAKNKILGISHLKFNVEPNSSNEIKINVEPAGAMIAWLYNYPHFLDIKQIHLGSNKLVSGYIFNADGSYEVNAEYIDEEYDNKRLFVYNDYSSYEGESCNHDVYGYCFVLPSVYNLKWMYSDTHDNFENMYAFHGTPMTVDIKAGQEWFFVLDTKESAYGFWEIEESRFVGFDWDKLGTSFTFENLTISE